ncbi:MULTISPECIES: DNA-directed RNA polymerase subunit delta [Bacillaceae]|uniref:Probable DNA-directed RNA polymerase subunit delta n=1 Tax=Oceanobacillus caeni TaxID=405946 RepID=A0ABR5MH78_9BACI|nr:MULTISPECIES: DNA-directed RNA polymerase subunit delta [Bacillaceae]KKE77769.1 DNA-directed RNA polymerase subunit delta [Bacilli bacterium VT-13-104]PZD87304.1 DNA-directed RNA polymerase subunit delta [Bacilli bacterium]KPH72772.1 DNA-directed RNA polymerase subunit delta [Oceanobacillus caeni]MBU8789882.1 DNA-directed RNA polymerase subunit delta [Oceanobacillus caeni]MED4473892.1 DNA-directed RNA polymerase subunit delta [Oceanobacillus caeni]
MSLKDYSPEQIENMSMLELASIILKEEKKALHFKDVFDKVAEVKGFSEAEKEEKIAQFYTDLNVDGRFTTLGSNMWGLKRWYPIEQADEEVHTPKKKKKKATKKKRKEEEIDEEEDFEEEDDLLEDEDIDEVFDDEEEDLDEDDEELDPDLDEFDDFDEDEEEIDEEFDDEELDDEEEEEK